MDIGQSRSRNAVGTEGTRTCWAFGETGAAQHDACLLVLIYIHSASFIYYWHLQVLLHFQRFLKEFCTQPSSESNLFAQDYICPHSSFTLTSFSPSRWHLFRGYLPGCKCINEFSMFFALGLRRVASSLQRPLSVLQHIFHLLPLLSWHLKG